MDNSCYQLLFKIQQLSFTALELNLYLDTHPNDQQTLTMYNKVHRDLMRAVQEYEKYYGPLVNFGYSPASQNYWKWIEGPWPWEINY
ncbi:MAG: spore coat protein CotJB [Clostridiales bacterium]|nr:spore coat protein CotJB [Clostridiales bacterium]MCF8023352.1 spore coat protein CotJB [Clostridiales bacterium]